MKVRYQIKKLLAENCVTIKQIAQMLTEKTGKTYSAKSFSHKLERESLTLKETFEIAELLNCKVEFKKISDKK